MAGSSSGEEEENYWPGYVDALSAMTKVLVFVMMILGIAVFSLSQNVSKAYLESLAKTAQVNPAAVANRTPDQLRDELQAAVERLVENAVQSDATIAALNKQIEALGGANAKPAVELMKELEKQRSTIADLKREIQKASSGSAMSATSTDGKLVIDTVSVQPERETSSVLDTAEPIVANTTVDQMAGQLKVVYEDRSVRLADTARAEIKDFLGHILSSTPGAAFTIDSIVSIDRGSVSENRRHAYFRGMSVRQELVLQGIPVERIRVLIRDVTNGELANVILVTARPVTR